MPQTFYTAQSAEITLGPKLGSGGEGEVYELRGQPELVAKLYHEPLAAERAEKLQVLARLGNEGLFKIAAWPVDVLRAEPASEVCGFLMRKISRAAEVHTLHSPKSRLQKFPEASWAFLIYVAANIARAVATVHEQGFIIGDMNPKNILVTRQATVYLLDCDSFQMTAEGKTYRCAGGVPEYTPPELQGVIFREVDRRREHDWFGLGVVIFQLLFLGRHPFSGKFTGAGELTLERAIRERRFAYGADAAARAMQPPPGTLALEAASEPLVELFRAAFLSADAVTRPRPQEWIAPLERLAKSLKQCALHNGHRYWRELAACPWCEIETRARVRLFNFALNGKRGESSYFPLDEVWREIESVAPPSVPALPNNQALALAPSAEAQAVVRRKRNGFYLAILMSLLSGFAIGMWTGFPFALFLLIVAGLIAHHVARVELDYFVVLTLRQRSQPADPLAQPFEQDKQRAEAELRELAERWKNEASEERFNARRSKLESWKVAYESLSFKRTQQLKRLEEQTKTRQLERFLSQFELDKTVLKNFAPAFYENLRLEGIRTAADVTSARLKKTPLVGAGLAQILLNWRNELEREFVFDPQTAVPPHLRFILERKLDETRVRLEHDLRGGAFCLNRLKDEIKESQQALHAPFLAAQTKLAQAKKDCEAVAKRRPFLPLAALLLVSFFFGMFWSTRTEGQRRLAAQVARTAPITAPIKTNTQADPVFIQPEPVGTATDYYLLGWNLVKQGRYKEAERSFRQAISVNPRFAGGYKGLAYTLYQLGKYDEALPTSQKAISLAREFQPYYVQGLVYFEQGNWAGARSALTTAIRLEQAPVPSDQYLDAHHKLAASIIKLGGAHREIQTLEAQLAGDSRNPKLTIRLGTLYFLMGDLKAAEQQRQFLLAQSDSISAAILSDLMLTRLQQGSPH